MQLNNRSINEVIDRIRQAEIELNIAIIYAQEHCTHGDIAECDYSSSYYRDTFPPIRICLGCGLTEEGWGCGYRTLVERDNQLSPRRISRDLLYKLRIGKIIKQQ
jgi:hypothetical protein